MFILEFSYFLELTVVKHINSFAFAVNSSINLCTCMFVLYTANLGSFSFSLDMHFNLWGNYRWSPQQLYFLLILLNSIVRTINCVRHWSYQCGISSVPVVSGVFSLLHLVPTFMLDLFLMFSTTLDGRFWYNCQNFIFLSFKYLILDVSAWETFAILSLEFKIFWLEIILGSVRTWSPFMV